MTDLKACFEKEFSSLRSVDIDGGTWFSAEDIAVTLGYSDPDKAIKRHVDPSDIKILNGRKRALYINEPGVYSLIFGSRLPSAKRFKHWVTSEVLPATRKDGGYIHYELSEDEIVETALKIAKQILGKRVE